MELGLLTEDNSSLSMDDWESYVDFTDDDTIDNIVATVPPVSLINEKPISLFHTEIKLRLPCQNHR